MKVILRNSTFTLTALCAIALAWTGCDTSSSNDFARNVGIDFSGFYANNNTPIISMNSGLDITALNLRQTGDRLEAVDNFNNIFRGSIGAVINGEASFTMRGRTTAGVEGTMSGVLTGGGGTGTMRGTWVEPNAFGTVFATASISQAVGLALDPSGNITLATGASQVFTVSGGTGEFTWSLSDNNLGTLSSTTGDTVTYTASGPGSQIVTATDGNGTVSAMITQN